MDEDDFILNLTASGKAIGFALALAFRNGADLQKDAGLLALAESIQALSQDGHFPDDVAVVMDGLADGLVGFVDSPPLIDGRKELF